LILIKLNVILDDGNFPSLRKPDVRKTTITETPSAPVIVVKSKPTPKQFFKSRLTLCLYVVFLCQILILLIYLWTFFRKKPSVHIIEHRFRQSKELSYKNNENSVIILDVYIPKNGRTFDDIDGKLFNHAENLSLTFANRLTRIDAYSHHDDLYSIKFIYSQNKSIEHKLRNITRLHKPSLSSVDFVNENVQQITQYYNTNNLFGTKSVPFLMKLHLV
jgi:hypothetical protein